VEGSDSAFEEDDEEAFRFLDELMEESRSFFFEAGVLKSALSLSLLVLSALGVRSASPPPPPLLCFCFCSLIKLEKLNMEPE
jgi:hypothetical protein